MFILFIHLLIYINYLSIYLLRSSFSFFYFKMCIFIYMYLLFVHSLARLIIVFNFYYWKLCHLLHSFTRIWANKCSVCTYKIRSSAKSDLTFQYPSKPTTDITYYDLPGKYTISTIRLIGQAFDRHDRLNVNQNYNMLSNNFIMYEVTNQQCEMEKKEKV